MEYTVLRLLIRYKKIGTYFPNNLRTTETDLFLKIIWTTVQFLSHVLEYVSVTMARQQPDTRYLGRTIVLCVTQYWINTSARNRLTQIGINHSTYWRISNVIKHVTRIN
jgi:hypothetical protein